MTYQWQISPDSGDNYVVPFMTILIMTKHATPKWNSSIVTHNQDKKWRTLDKFKKIQAMYSTTSAQISFIYLEFKREAVQKLLI